MRDQLLQMTGVLALVIAALGYLALRSWRGAIITQQRMLPALPAVPATADRTGAFECQYVVSTIAGEPLNRIKAHGLGHRGKALVSFVPADGNRLTVVVDRVGEATLAIAEGSIVSVELASATLDRAVEKDGLVCVRWTSNATAFDTYLRVMNSELRERLLAVKTPTEAVTAD